MKLLVRAIEMKMAGMVYENAITQYCATWV